MGWLERNGDMERNGQMLERILALLLALAAIADRASGLPAPVRLRLLAILCPGEAAARGLVIGTTPGAKTEAAAASHEAGPAALLAARCRALACVVGALLVEARRLARVLRHEASRRAAGTMPPRGPARPIVWRPAPPLAPDTS